MTDIEKRLQDAFEADAPPMRDAMFRIDVVVRRDRAMLRRGLVASGAISAAGVAVALLALGVFEPLLGAGAERLAPVAVAALLIAGSLTLRNLQLLSALQILADPWRNAARSIFRRIPSDL